MRPIDLSRRQWAPFAIGSMAALAAACAGASSGSSTAPATTAASPAIHDSNDEPGHVAAVARLRDEVCEPMARDVCAARARCSCAPPADASPCEATVLITCLSYAQREHVASDNPAHIPRYAYDETRARTALELVRANVAHCGTWNVDWESPIVNAASLGEACGGPPLPALPPGVASMPSSPCMGGRCREGTCRGQDGSAPACTNSDACPDGACVEGRCWTRETIHPALRECDGRSCDPNEICMRTRGFSCVPFVARGAECGYSDQCTTGDHCVGGHCIEPHAAGAACADPEECVSRVCQAGACAVPEAPGREGEPCAMTGCESGLDCVREGTEIVCARRPSACEAPCGAGQRCSLEDTARACVPAVCLRERDVMERLEGGSLASFPYAW